jgi:fatty acid desaturase
MSSKNQEPTSSGIGVFGLMGVMFIGLKLTGYVTWPWLWVLAPFWIPAAIVFGVLFTCSVVVGVLQGIEDSKNARR